VGALSTPVVLAVSGGIDSMVLADALHRREPSMLAAIATFDHGTGPAARAAAALVTDWGAARGITVHAGRAEPALAPTEAAWRRARWAFLTDVGRRCSAPVATAHTADDQVETVFMRLVRGSGVRGLAGLLAPSRIARPLLAHSREEVCELATRHAVPFLEDPSNSDLRHLRNRVRLELLPALERAEPGFRAWLLDLGRRAAEWRRDVADAVDACWQPAVATVAGVVVVPRNRRRLPKLDEAALFWPEVAGRVGVALDRRGTARLASFTTRSVTNQRIPLSGGAVVTSRRDAWRLERTGAGGADCGPSERWAPCEG